jgi:hypothetical protein
LCKTRAREREYSNNNEARLAVESAGTHVCDSSDMTIVNLGTKTIAREFICRNNKLREYDRVTIEKSKLEKNV